MGDLNVFLKSYVCENGTMSNSSGSAASAAHIFPCDIFFCIITFNSGRAERRGPIDNLVKMPSLRTFFSALLDHIALVVT